MSKDEKRKSVSLEIVFFAVVSVLAHFVIPLLIDLTDPGIKNILTVIASIMCAGGLLYFIYERRAGLPFFYGVSQRGGSNANSFIVLAIGAALFRVSNVQFFIIVAAMAVGIAILSYVIPTKSSK
ncbi:MAG: hypothetical protein GX852_06750 [Clostridiales bacterium]|jgi:hypothetical protein|nr:hypothetical protein [Clostridiales bacterium]